MSSQAAVLKVPLPDLLMHWLLHESEGSEEAARRRVELEVIRCLGT